MHIMFTVYAERTTGNNNSLANAHVTGLHKIVKRSIEAQLQSTQTKYNYSTIKDFHSQNYLE